MGIKPSNPLLWSEHALFPLQRALPEQARVPDLGRTIYLCGSGLLSLELDLAEGTIKGLPDSTHQGRKQR